MNLVFGFFVPRPFTTAITTTAMSAAIRPYSIAVAPDSSLRNARSRSHKSIPYLRLNGLEEAPAVGRGLPGLSRVRHIPGHPILGKAESIQGKRAQHERDPKGRPSKNPSAKTAIFNWIAP